MARVGIALYSLVGSNLGLYECDVDVKVHWHLYSLDKKNATVAAKAADNRRTKARKKRKKFRDQLVAQVKSPQQPGPLGCILGF